ncbi:hypothetical protein M501DRAFT_229335 [Patellaria atrata CBS 101060]|uniref:Uncharacterized protein n=1 Tax=Patellaria atrata CBS 101060 TaxID=1346257 RepID=A0A9P4S7P3_9PEZI|nr:hypothetical protein M501DRAFT_229335 [Patellaria atrata CBS 101060]
MDAALVLRSCGLLSPLIVSGIFVARWTSKRNQPHGFHPSPDNWYGVLRTIFAALIHPAIIGCPRKMLGYQKQAAGCPFSLHGLLSPSVCVSKSWRKDPRTVYAVILAVRCPN